MFVRSIGGKMPLVDGINRLVVFTRSSNIVGSTIRASCQWSVLKATCPCYRGRDLEHAAQGVDQQEFSRYGGGVPGYTKSYHRGAVRCPVLKGRYVLFAPWTTTIDHHIITATK